MWLSILSPAPILMGLHLIRKRERSIMDECAHDVECEATSHGCRAAL